MVDSSWAFKLIMIGAGAYVFGKLLEPATKSQSKANKHFYTVENTQNHLSNAQIADIMAFARVNALTFHQALQVFCDTWNLHSQDPTS